jgi:hypothetical protein
MNRNAGFNFFLLVKEETFLLALLPIETIYNSGVNL